MHRCRRKEQSIEDSMGLQLSKEPAFQQLPVASQFHPAGAQRAVYGDRGRADMCPWPRWTGNLGRERFLRSSTRRAASVCRSREPNAPRRAMWPSPFRSRENSRRMPTGTRGSGGARAYCSRIRTPRAGPGVHGADLLVKPYRAHDGQGQRPSAKIWPMSGWIAEDFGMSGGEQ